MNLHHLSRQIIPPVIEDTFSIDSIDRSSDDSSLLDDSETLLPLDDPSVQIPVLPLLDPPE